MTLHTFPYSTAYDPAMPVLEITVEAPHSGQAITHNAALIDSGADGTLVPVDLLERIGAISIATGRLTWLWQTSRRVSIYIVRLRIGAYTLPRVHVAGVPVGTDLIVGRNVLNQMRLTLDGLALTTEMP